MNIYRNFFNQTSFVRTIMTKRKCTKDEVIRKLAQIIVSGSPSSQSIPFALFEESLSTLKVPFLAKEIIWEKLSRVAVPRFQKIMEDIYIDHVINKLDKKEILLLYAANKRIKNEKLSLANQSSKLTIESWGKELPEDKIEVAKKLNDDIKAMEEKFISFFDTDEKRKICDKFVAIESKEIDMIRIKTTNIYAEELLQLKKE